LGLPVKSTIKISNISKYISISREKEERTDVKTALVSLSDIK
jgi:hypothetical protein